MKRLVFVGVCCFWSLYAVGMFSDRQIGESSSNHSLVPVGEDRDKGEASVKSIENGIRSMQLPVCTYCLQHRGGYLQCPSCSQFLIEGKEQIQIIFDQHQKRAIARLNEKDQLISSNEEKITVLENQNKEKQREIDNQDRIITQQEEKIIALENQNKEKQREIDEQDQIIIRQNESLCQLKGQVEKKDDENNRLKDENNNFRSIFKLANDTCDKYVASRPTDYELKEQYSKAQNVFQKFAVVVLNVVRCNTEQEDNDLHKEESSDRGVCRKKRSQNSDLNHPSKKQRDLTENTVVDATRHDFMLQFYGEKSPSFSLGDRYKCTGDVRNNVPHGEMTIYDKNGAMKITATYVEGFLDMTKPIKFLLNKVERVFQFPGKLHDKYRELISYLDIADMKFRFGANTLIFYHSNDDTKVDFIFSEDYVFVGLTNDLGEPGKSGVKFCKDGHIQTWGLN